MFASMVNGIYELRSRLESRKHFQDKKKIGRIFIVCPIDKRIINFFTYPFVFCAYMQTIIV